jgi:hypothetical protein
MEDFKAGLILLFIIHTFRERISSKFIDDLDSRLQKGSLALT